MNSSVFSEITVVVREIRGTMIAVFLTFHMVFKL
jgi:hypothetical protein